MELNDVLYNAQAESGAARFTRAPFVHSVETLEKMRQILLRYPRSVVDDRATHHPRAWLQNGYEAELRKVRRIAEDILDKIIQDLVYAVAIE